MKDEKDIVRDIFYRVKDILGPEFKGEIKLRLEQEEQQVRMDWGGTEPYIKKKVSSEKKKKIIKSFESCKSVSQVARETGISRAQVYHLLKRK